MTPADRRTFKELERRLITLLPEDYGEDYDAVPPVSMGSAGVVYGADGQVAWDEIWGSFCDLAMAGGPPHKGTLLEPASPAEVDANPDRYAAVLAELRRGITLVTELETSVSPDPGWVRVTCLSRGMAAWLLRAIAMENVAVRICQSDPTVLELPAGPAYRVEKEIKNVITVIAKTTHYWLDHMSVPDWRTISALIQSMEDESPLVAPSYGLDAAGADAMETRNAVAARVGDAIYRDTRLRRSERCYTDWIGIDAPSVRAAVWMMRLLVSVNVLSRREQATLFVPINPSIDPDGAIVSDSVALIHRLAVGRRILGASSDPADVEGSAAR